jgi:serine/threonine-protein kinase RsbW
MNYSIKIPCDKEKLKEIRCFVSNTLKKHDLPEMEINRLVLAVDEVCANLIIHSHNCDSNQFIQLYINFKDNDEVTFEIIDYGIGFNICNYCEPNLEDIVKEKKKGGVGLMLVKRIVDLIEFKKGKEQNIYLLHKKFHPPANP